jgi:hypothetical protein
MLPRDMGAKTTLSYCQRNDPKVMNTTGESCMAISWFWAMAHFKDEHAPGIKLYLKFLMGGSLLEIEFCD